MTKIYQILKNFVVKPLLYTGLSAMILTGCNESSSYENPPTERRQKMNKYSFDNWGFVTKLRCFEKEVVEMELGDFDGDGDLDIVVVSSTNGLELYENKIPQSIIDDMKR